MTAFDFVNGDADIIQAFDRMPDKMRKKAMRKVTRAVAKEEVLPIAIERVPEDTGALRRSLTVRSGKLKRGTKRTRVAASVTSRNGGLFQGETYYGGFQEFGWITRSGLFNPGFSFLRAAIYSERAAKLRSFRKHARVEVQKIVDETRKEVKLQNASSLLNVINPDASLAVAGL